MIVVLLQKVRTMGNDDATWRVVELAATFRIHIRSQRERTAAHKGIWAKYLSLVHDHYIVYTISWWWWWLYRCVAPDLSLQNINERESPENRGGWDAMRLFFFVFRYLSTSALFLSLFRIEKPLQSEIATTKIYISRIYNIQFPRCRPTAALQALRPSIAFGVHLTRNDRFAAILNMWPASYGEGASAACNLCKRRKVV